MKITKEYIVDFLIKLYKFRNAHNDYKNLHQEQLDVIVRHLDIKDKILVKDGEIVFKRLFNDYLKCVKKENSDSINLDSTERVISMYLNDCLKKINHQRTIQIQTSTTNDEMLTVEKSMDLRTKDYAINALNTSVVNIYKLTIMSLLDDLYSSKVEFVGGKPSVTSLNRASKIWNINKIVSKEDEDILNKQLCDWDYY